MKLHGTTNYAEWSSHMTAHFDSLSLLPIINGTLQPPLPPTSPSSTNDPALAFHHANTHAHTILISSLSDAVYTDIFPPSTTTTASPTPLLTDAKPLWDELRTRYTEPDVFATYFSLHTQLSSPKAEDVPMDVHMQRFVRGMRKLNEVAGAHGLEGVPEWYQIVMLVASVQGGSADMGGKEGERGGDWRVQGLYEAFKGARMKSLGKLRMRDLAGDCVEGGAWVRELEMRRGGEGGGVRNEEGGRGKGRE